MMPTRRWAHESHYMPAPANAERVLVIKLGPLGDFIPALAAAKLGPDHHVCALITLLTSEPYRAFAERCPYFDVGDADGRPRAAKGTADLLARIRAAKFDMVYDLETTERTNNYFLA